MSYDNIELSREELRRIIQGKVSFRRCPDCNRLGFLCYVAGSDLPVSQEQYENSGGCSNIENDTNCCDTCKGLGYISNEMLL